MTLTLSTCFVQVTDADLALDFYRDTLGLEVRTDDLDGMFENLRSSGAEIVQEPTEQFWGTRDCAVRDPSGNLVRIDQPPAASS